MKKLLLILLLAGAASAFADGLPTTPYLYVQGFAEERLAPDTLTLSFSVNATDKDQVAAKATVSGKSAAVFALFKKLAIADDAVAAHEISVNENYEYPSGKRVFNGYTVTRNFTVRLTDFATYPKLVDDLIALRIDSLSGAQPSLSKAAEIATRLKKAALAQARQQADDLAAGMNAKITGVFAASPIAFGEIPQAIFGGSGGGGPQPMSAFAVRAQDAGGEDKYVFEKLTPSERLHVIFLIEPQKP
jgi:uncharacterized protein YggE